MLNKIGGQVSHDTCPPQAKKKIKMNNQYFNIAAYASL